MRSKIAVLVLGLAAVSASFSAHSAPPLVKFKDAIGVDPLTAANGADTLNVVRGINPGGRAWVIRDLRATVKTDGTITATGAGLLFASGEVIGTRGPVTHVAATLACGPADATAAKFNSPAAPLDAAGNFQISGALSDGANPAALPDVCANPVLLIRSFSPATSTLGGWFAAGIPDVD